MIFVLLNHKECFVNVFKIIKYLQGFTNVTQERVVIIKCYQLCLVRYRYNVCLIISPNRFQPQVVASFVLKTIEK